MKFNLTLFCLLFSLTLLAQKDGDFKDYYDSGELKVEGQYKNKKKIGNWKSYHKNGQVSRLYSYNSKGKRNKKYTSFFEDGTVSYKTEKLNGEFLNKGFYKTGELLFVRQIKNGYYKEYLKNGKLKIESNYNDSALSGQWKQYYENGNIEWSVFYKDGYKHGDYKNFYENGDLKIEGETKYGVKNAKEKRYLPNGVLEWEGKYSEDVLDKTWVKYNSDGDKIEKIKFKDGVALNSKTELKPTEIPIGTFEQVPVYPGCNENLGNKNLKKCMSQSIAMFVSKRFNADLATSLNLSGKQSILVKFKINKSGNIVNINAKAPHPVLQQEAIRVIKLLPQLKPGFVRCKTVVVPYTLPITFNVTK